ncbi:MAG: hypothetical protein IJD86_01610 [Clostridia bacterium]|nr:hypothetical protein [Clostridia bacterium]
MMKRIFILFLALIMAFQAAAVSEGAADKGLLSGFGNAFSDAWSALQDAAEDALDDLGGAWDEAKEELDEAWDEAKDEIDEAWRIAGDAAGEAWDEMKAAASEAWDIADSFFKENGDELIAAAEEQLTAFVDWLANAGDRAVSAVQAGFEAMLKELEIDQAQVDQLWTSVKAYAKECAIEIRDMATLVIAAVIQVAEDAEDGNLTESVMDYIEENGITDQETAEQALKEIEKSIEEAQNQGE